MAPRNRHIVHYIPPSTIYPTVTHEFVEPTPADYFIHWLFRYRCMECQRPGQEINEILPRSRSKKNIMNWRNRVVLCRTCHTKYHAGGVTETKIQAMQELRRTYLLSIDRASYL